jgi:urease accessory protein
MARDSQRMRGDGPTVFAQVKNDVGVDAIVEQVVKTWERATEKAGRAG